MFEPFNNIILGGPHNPLNGTPYEGVLCDSDPTLTIQAFLAQLEEYLQAGHDVIVKDFGFSAMPFIDLLPVQDAKHVLVIRHPVLVNLSWKSAFARMEPEILTAFKVFVSRVFAGGDSNFEKSQSHAFEKAQKFYDLLKSKGCQTMVIESKDLQEKPAASVKAVCEFTDLPYDPSCLKWESAAQFPEEWNLPTPCKQRQARLKLQTAVMGSTGLEASSERSLAEVDTSHFTDDEKLLTQDMIPYYLSLQKDAVKIQQS
jgi:hypothetical protein